MTTNEWYVYWFGFVMTTLTKAHVLTFLTVHTFKPFGFDTYVCSVGFGSGTPLEPNSIDL